MGFLGFGNSKSKEVALQSAFRKAKDVVEAHMDELIKKRTKGIKVSPSGFVDSTGWNKSANTFLRKTLAQHFTQDEANSIQSYGLKLFINNYIEKPVRWQLQKNKWEVDARKNEQEKADRIKKQEAQKLKELAAQKIKEQKGPMTPVQYEEHCAKLISKLGWVCEPTKYTGDQGADIVAKKGGKVLVVQCKQYSSSVGNGAVQEVIGARGYYLADYAAVVTNSTYTRSANELAVRNGVILLNHDEIPQLDKRIKLNL